MAASCLWGGGSVLCACVPGAYWRAPQVPGDLGVR